MTTGALLHISSLTLCNFFIQNGAKVDGKWVAVTRDLRPQRVSADSFFFWRAFFLIFFYNEVCTTVQIIAILGARALVVLSGRLQVGVKAE
jgi:hypothetical protein